MRRLDQVKPESPNRVPLRRLSPYRPTESPLLQGFQRADARIRTADPFITSEVLYQLSYVGEASTLAVPPTASSWSEVR